MGCLLPWVRPHCARLPLMRPTAPCPAPRDSRRRALSARGRSCLGRTIPSPRPRQPPTPLPATPMWTRCCWPPCAACATEPPQRPVSRCGLCRCLGLVHPVCLILWPCACVPLFVRPGPGPPPRHTHTCNHTCTRTCTCTCTHTHRDVCMPSPHACRLHHSTSLQTPVAIHTAGTPPAVDSQQLVSPMTVWPPPRAFDSNCQAARDLTAQRALYPGRKWTDTANCRVQNWP
jgi:hypothetical protein